jgi:hypothetical protein
LEIRDIDFSLERVNNKNMDNTMSDMGRVRPEMSTVEKPVEPRGPEYPRLHGIDADKLPLLKTTPIGSTVILTIKAKLTGLEMHDQKNGIDSYYPANSADLEILEAKVDSTEPKTKSNNKEVDLGELPMGSMDGGDSPEEE